MKLPLTEEKLSVSRLRELTFPSGSANSTVIISPGQELKFSEPRYRIALKDMSSPGLATLRSVSKVQRRRLSSFDSSR